MKIRNYILMALVGIGVSACQKSCQPPPTGSLQSIVAAQWRLVESTDPDVTKTLDNYNFLIMRFDRNNTGAINKVVSNELYENPVSYLKYVVASQGHVGQLQIEFSSSPTGNGDQGTFAFEYALTSTGLELSQVNSNNYYRYVPFVGIVDPDNTCVFK